MAINKVYAGGAVQTVAQGSFTPTVPGAGGTFTVDDDTGYPTTGPFPVKLNRGLSDEEHVLISSRADKVFTIGQRGFDGTTAQAHSSPTCEIYFDATSANLIVDHVDDVEADPHATKLLNTVRHDLPARHTYGGASTAFGTRPTPSSVGTANAAGSSNTPAAGDHVHDIANGSIDGSALFGAGVVDATALGSNSVTTAKILNGNVTEAKQAPGTYIPIGGIIIWLDASISSNWLLCNGQAVDRTTYATLFALWGTDFGAGNGTTTFNVPDLRGRFPLGVAAAGTGSSLGGTGGTMDHTHSLATGYAKVTAAAGSSNNMWIDRQSVSPNWNSVVEGDLANTGGATVSNNTGAALGGSSDTANPPFIAVHFHVRAL